MIRMDMSLRDFIFLKETVPSSEQYITCVAYQDENVRIEMPEKFLRSFLLDFRSSYIRLGTGSGQALNETGIRMDRIYLESISPALSSDHGTR